MTFLKAELHILVDDSVCQHSWASFSPASHSFWFWHNLPLKIASDISLTQCNSCSGLSFDKMQYWATEWQHLWTLREQLQNSDKETSPEPFLMSSSTLLFLLTSFITLVLFQKMFTNVRGSYQWQEYPRMLWEAGAQKIFYSFKSANWDPKLPPID